MLLTMSFPKTNIALSAEKLPGMLKSSWRVWRKY